MRNASEHNKNDQSGVTIVELLVVCIVIAIIAAFAFMQRGTADAQLKRQNVAQVLKSALERARFDSVKRRADDPAIQARVLITETTITLTTDRNQDGVLDTADDQVNNIGGQNIVISGNVDIGLPATVIFNQRGEASLSGAPSTSPIFFVCNGGCGSMPNPNANIILVTPTGTVNLLPGTSSVPFFSPPSGLTTVPPTNAINNTAVVTPTP